MASTPVEQKPRFGTASRNPAWADAYVVGGGPSLAGFDFNRLREQTLIAVNDAAFSLPYPSVLFTLDLTWIGHRRRELTGFPGKRYCAVPEDYDLSKVPPGPVYLKRGTAGGFSVDPSRVHMGGGHGGFGAINLALLFGARRLFLLGFDFTHYDRRFHWHEGYSWSGGFNSRMYQKWAQRLDDESPWFKRRGIDVYNASPCSLLRRYPYIPLDRLPRAGEAAA